MKLYKINYGSVVAINKEKNLATIRIDNYGNTLVRLPKKIKSAITGEEVKLNIGMRVSLIPEMDSGEVTANKIKVFVDNEEEPLFDDHNDLTDYQAETKSYEPQFADKNLGIVVRNDVSKYGSLPLYDDYGDESSS